MRTQVAWGRSGLSGCAVSQQGTSNAGGRRSPVVGSITWNTHSSSHMNTAMLPLGRMYSPAPATKHVKVPSSAGGVRRLGQCYLEPLGY